MLFVPIGILFFDRTLQEVYIQNIIPKFVIELTGFQNTVFGFYGYNPTWWFVGLILGFYAIFPWLYVMLKKHPILFGLGCFLMTVLPVFGNIPRIGVMLSRYAIWLFPFAIGMIFAELNIFSQIKSYQTKNSKYWKMIFYTLVLVFLLVFRKYGFLVSDIKIDGFLGIMIIIISFEYISSTGKLGSCLIYLGKHSFNIFLFHTFIYYYYFKDFIYSFQNELIIFSVMLIICLIISEGIEFLRDKYQSYYI